MILKPWVATDRERTAGRTVINVTVFHVHIEMKYKTSFEHV